MLPPQLISTVGSAFVGNVKVWLKLRIRDSPALQENLGTDSIFKSCLPRLNFAKLYQYKYAPPLTNITALHLYMLCKELLLNQFIKIIQMPKNLVTLSLTGEIDWGNYD
jgi:hypothetical protein